MKTSLATPSSIASLLVIGFFSLFASASLHAQAGDPLFTSWLTGNSGLYAWVFATEGGPPDPPWQGPGPPTMGGANSRPAYSDIKQIRYSASYVYIKGNGLASHQMGPWYGGVNTIFGNWPKNQNYIRRIP